MPLKSIGKEGNIMSFCPKELVNDSVQSTLEVMRDNDIDLENVEFFKTIFHVTYTLNASLKIQELTNLSINPKITFEN